MPNPAEILEIETRIVASLTGGLSEVEEQDLRVTLAAHPEYEKLYKELNAMNEGLDKSFSRQRPDSGFEGRMVQAFRKASPRRTQPDGWKTFWIWGGPSFRWATAGTVLVLFLFVGQIVQRKTEPLDSTFSPHHPRPGIMEV